MSFSTATLSSLNGFFKQRHLETLEKLVPEDFFAMRDWGFRPDVKLGRQFRKPVHLTYPHGVTFSASDSVPTLAAPIAAEVKEMTFDAYQMIMRERISYDAGDRASSTAAAYENEVGFLMEALRMSHTHKRECLLWYGQHADGLGTVASISTNTLRITTAQWAPDIWAGSENLRLDVYTGSTYVKTVSVSSVDLDTMDVTVDNAASITAADALHFAGSYGNTSKGFHAISTETSTQFGVAVTYNLLKGVTQSASSGRLKLEHLLQAGAKARVKGLRGSVKAYVNDFSFADLDLEVEQARTDPQRGGGSRRIERGAENMTVYGANAKIEIQVCGFVKKGLAFLSLNDGSWGRYGTSDVTFRYPGTDKEQYFIHLQESAGYEFRSWSNDSLFSPRPGASAVITNIVNSIDGGV
jgi:hypothetical protein